MKSAARRILKLLGWRLDERLPDASRYVVIGAYHTSNWDFPLALLAIWALGFEARWVAKHTLFKGVLGPIMRLLGGIPVDRTARSGFISQVAERMKSGQIRHLVIAPEGTRAATDHWKTGFYHIAREANVPIALGYVDFSSRTLGVGGQFTPGGDISSDFELIRSFYAGKTGRIISNQGTIDIRRR